MVLTYQSTEIYPSSMIFKLNHRLFLNTLDGITEEQAKERISEHSDPFIRIASHTVWARYNTLDLLGKPIENPFEGLFENFKAYDPDDIYPTLVQIKTIWENVGNLLKEALHHTVPEQLAKESPFKNTTGNFTIGEAIVFQARQESHHIGQMVYLKKYFTGR